MTAPRITDVALLFRRALRPLFDPYRRYQHARLIHAVRVALGILLTITLSTGIRIPHGEWSSISFLIVIAGLQHHGNIRRRATERAFGTVIGAVTGLGILLQQSWLDNAALTWSLLAIGCGISAYHAIGKGGYIALLSAITLVIVVGHGENALIDGLYRSVNVLIGILIALLFSFALPLYATFSWRFKLAEALRGCAKIYARLQKGPPFTVKEHALAIAKQRALLLQLRSLMPWVTKEADIPDATLEAIQLNLRISISLLELLPTIQRPPGASADETLQMPLPVSDSVGDAVRYAMIGMSRALKYGLPARLSARASHSNGRSSTETGNAAQALSHSADALSQQLEIQIGQMRRHLADTAAQWNM